jgi:hypothetical protein
VNIIYINFKLHLFNDGNFFYHSLDIRLSEVRVIKGDGHIERQ